MQRTIALLALFAALGPARAEAQSPINAVVGDQSWVQAHGRAPTAADDARELERIQTHLAWVERRLREASTSALTPELASRRERLLAALARYRDKGAFPRNEAHEGRRPRFIDREGNVCAVGHLVELSAGRGLAEAIDRHHEYEYLLDMRSSALASWVARSGFEAKELAMVQPSYRHMPGPGDFEPRPVEPVRRPPMTRAVLARVLAQANGMIGRCVAQYAPESRAIRVGVRYGRRGIKILASTRNRALDTCIQTAVQRLINRTGTAAPRRPITLTRTYRFGGRRGPGLPAGTGA